MPFWGPALAGVNSRTKLTPSNKPHQAFNSVIPGNSTTLFSAFLGSFQGWASDLWHPVRWLYQNRVDTFGRLRDFHIGGFPFHYRDYVRRFVCLLQRRHLTGSQSIAAVMRTMRRRNLERMVMVASLHSIESVSPEDQEFLVQLIQEHLQTRHQNRDRRGKKATKLFTPLFASTLMDDLPLQRILASREMQSLLPACMRHVHFMLGFQYSKPIKCYWFNYKKFITQHTYAELQAIADGPCDCHLPRFDRFKVPGCDHVVAFSSDFLRQECPDLPNLAAIWDRGSKYRPQLQHGHSHDFVTEAAAEISAAMSRLRKRLVKQFSVNDNCLDPWCTEVLAKMHQALHALPDSRPSRPAGAPLYGRAERASMERLLDKYICSATDKMSSNMALTCKHIACRHELQDIVRQSAVGQATYEPEVKSLAELVQASEPIFQESQISCGDVELPYYYPIPKIHKPQLAFRFITSCGQFYLRNIAVWVTRFLRAIERPLNRVWDELDFPSELQFGRSRPWVIKTSAQIVSFVNRFNMSHSLERLDAAAPNLLSADFERLYTELDQGDLKAKLVWLIDKVFQLQEKTCVRVRKGMSPKWVEGNLPAKRKGRDRGVVCYTFSAQSARSLLIHLIDNAYFRVGDRVFRQVKGIPMGVSPAVYFANYYLFCYEYQFFQDALQAFSQATDSLAKSAIRQAIGCFRFAVRFVDDEAVITWESADMVQGLHYDNVSHAGVHGLYPSFLRLHSTTIGVGRVLHVLDVEVLPANVVSGPLITRLYDKRREAGFAVVRNIVRFPAIDSMLSLSCKLNVFDAQFVRFSRIITDVQDFCQAVVSLLVSMIRAGYPQPELLGRCKRRCCVTPVLFAVARGTERVPPSEHRPLKGLFPRIRDSTIARLRALHANT